MRAPAPARDDVAQAVCVVLERLRANAPRVHCITNAVAQNFTANALLALGCVPSMTLSAKEIGDFVARANALLVNLGTFDAERRQATELAVEVAAESRVPWVLDPVFVDRAPSRAAFARELGGRGPSLVRLNHAEFSTLSGAAPSRETVIGFARRNNLVVALSGEADLVSDGKRTLTVANGHPLMAKVTAMGCAVSAISAACLAVEPDAFAAAVAGLLIVGVAGEMAAETAKGPGSFAVAIIDALSTLDAATLASRARVS